MWILDSEKGIKRLYKNSKTNSTCGQTMCFTDKEGNQWWEFDSLIVIPYTRQFAASKITALYQLGLTKDDLTNHINGLKKILNSNDTEKFQKAYANILDFEAKAAQATDPVKQMSSLVCVYFTMNDEAIDSFIGEIQIRKMGILEADYEAHTFFLQRQIELMETSTNFLGVISQIASLPLSEMLAPLQQSNSELPILKGK